MWPALAVVCLDSKQQRQQQHLAIFVYYWPTDWVIYFDLQLSSCQVMSNPLPLHGLQPLITEKQILTIQSTPEIH